MPLKPEDYLEPECVLCDKPPGIGQPVYRIPQQRISAKLDELMAQKKPEEAERMLRYWEQEAMKGNDRQGLFMVYNEMMGFYRKTGNQEKAFQAIDDAIGMLDELGYRDSVSGATCYTNAGTVYTAFNEAEKSVSMFQQARIIYENNRLNNEFKLAGLYNNMAIAESALGHHEEAGNLYDLALDTLKGVEGSELEQAITCLNIIDAIINEKGYQLEDEDIYNRYLNKAKQLLDSETLPRDNYYSFVADKCVGIFEAFGWFRYVKELKERIREIDERA